MSNYSDQNNNQGFLTYLPRPSLSLKKLLFYLITLFAIAFIYFKFPDLQLIGRLFNIENYHWLIALIIAQVFIYYSQSLNYKYILEIKDLKINAIKLFPLSIVVQFLNNALPSLGLSGQVFFVQYMRQYGITVVDGIGRAFIEVMTLYMTMGVFFITSSVLLFQSDIISDLPQIRFLIYAFVFIAFLAVAFFFLLQRNRRGRFSNWLVNKLHFYFERKNKSDKKIIDHDKHIQPFLKGFDSVTMGFLRHHGRSFWAAFFWHNMVFLGHVFTLYFSSFIVGYPINFELAFIVLSLIKFLSMITFVPGSLGIYEGGMTLMLVSLGISAGPAFSMTLILRAFTFWLPMPLGWILYRFYFKNHE